jgi:FCD domain
MVPELTPRGKRFRFRAVGGLTTDHAERRGRADDDLVQLLRTIRALNAARMATLLAARSDTPLRYEEHRAIYRGIAAGDPVAAEAAMVRHMRTFTRVFLTEDGQAQGAI